MRPAGDRIADPLHGDLVHLGPLEKADLKLLMKWRNRWDIRSETREFRLLTSEHQARWWEGLVQDPHTLMFSILVPSAPQLIGVCGLTYIDWKNSHAELSCYIGDEDQRRKGHYSDALKVLTRYAFQELGLHMVWGEIYAWNEGALKACSKLGFRQEGPIRDRVFRFGDWWGSYFISMTETEWWE